MRFIYGLIAVSFCFFFGINAFVQAPPTEKASWSEIVDYAKATFPQEGTLVTKSDGYTYLKVDDDYIHALYPLLGSLKQSGFKEPPYFRSKESPGAHISVFYSDENVRPKEVGKKYHFTLKNIRIVHQRKDTSFAVLEVEAKDLEALRTKYGKSPKLHGHEFHITLARKQL